MNEARKRREIKDYFQKIKRHNEIKHNLQYIIIIVFFLLLLVLLSGNIFLIVGYLVFFVVACLAYLPGFSLSFEKEIDQRLEEDKKSSLIKLKES